MNPEIWAHKAGFRRKAEIVPANLAWLLMAALSVVWGPLAATSSWGAQDVRYSRDIQPILAKNCFACHGPDESTREGGVAFHTAELARSLGDSGEAAIVPGKPEESLLWTRINSPDESERMPPAEHGPALTASERDLIRRWLASGAEYDQHWAYLAVSRPAEPEVQWKDWARNPIDRFILAKLEAEGLEPEPPAERARLLRRLALDLTGLSPPPELLREFVEDNRPDAYERVVDRLLAEPTFGEHWARMWLDAARYADSQGYAQDEVRSIWKFRDWVINAFNRDLPFDQFTREQLAGDLLPEPTAEQRIATAFHRNTMTNTEGGTDDEEFRHAAVVDRTNTTGTVWLAMTVGCAQCHTHKFDPITQQEYYRLFAIFNQTADRDQPDNSPLHESWTAEQLMRKATLDERLKRLETQAAERKLAERIAAREAENTPERPLAEAEQRELAEWKKELESENRELAEVRGELGGIQPVTTPVMQELPTESRRQTRIAIRGSFLTPGDEVTPGVPAILQQGQPIENRLQLAEWLVDRRHPLTARVAVNRIWAQVFGEGLVETLDDFGSQGALPSHPELLDWLADEFVASGWSQKRMIKLMVMSATYQQGSRVTPKKLELDPQNRLLSRSPRYRLSAEQIRDTALQAAGLLSLKMYGPPVYPPQPKTGLSSAFGGSLDWDPSPGEDRYRRAIYTLLRRTNPYPSFLALDATNRTVCTVRRIRTNTPVSAFVTLNDPVYIECAQKLAERIRNAAATCDAERMDLAFTWVVSRAATEKEQAEVLRLLEQERTRYRAAPELARAMSGAAGDVSETDVIERAAWTVVANVLLNLDEALTRN
jgi:mono/diheme cytochrome c family protein